MTKKPSPISTPLSDDELDALADFLHEHSPFDLDGVLGLLHAVGVAPSTMPPSRWMPAVLPDGIGSLGKEAAQAFLLLLMRLYNEVIDALNAGEGMIPEPDDITGCDSFAAGYIAGAELDDAWFGDDDKWTFASWAACLAGRRDLVTPRHLVEFDKDPDESRSMLRRYIGASIRSTHESFVEARRRMMAQPAEARSARVGRVGRNDPCPCGSGKKYKRCCIDARTTTAH